MFRKRDLSQDKFSLFHCFCHANTAFLMHPERWFKIVHLPCFLWVFCLFVFVRGQLHIEDYIHITQHNVRTCSPTPLHAWLFCHSSVHLLPLRESACHAQRFLKSSYIKHLIFYFRSVLIILQLCEHFTVGLSLVTNTRVHRIYQSRLYLPGNLKIQFVSSTSHCFQMLQAEYLIH